MVSGWEPRPGDFPFPPANLEVLSAFIPGAFDLRWDNPALHVGMPQGNSQFQLVGVNLYRSDFSDRGPYHRVNVAPLGGQYYRDQAQYVYITNEVVTIPQWLFRGDGPNNRLWAFRTKCPIVKPPFMQTIHQPGSNQSPMWGNAPTDVAVTVNGEQATIQEVFGKSHEIRFVNQSTFDANTQKIDWAVLPESQTDTVLVSYYTIRNFIRSGLDSKIWYRATSVALDPNSPTGLIETPLAYSEPRSNIEVEPLDYIWREAIRRNNWILEQGGERVKIMIRKQAGLECCCNAHIDDRVKEYNKQPSARCRECFGTGFVGGYEGPYDIIVAPDDAERRVAQTDKGRRLEHSYEVWTGPSPAVTQRDFIVKQTNERYSIGPVRRPTNRGNYLQQHFTIGYLDEQDLRYWVPVGNTTAYMYPETRHTHEPHQSFAMNYKDEDLPYVIPEQRPMPPYQPGPTAVNPTITQKENIPDGRPAWEGEKRMRSATGENWEY